MSLSIVSHIDCHMSVPSCDSISRLSASASTALFDKLDDIGGIGGDTRLVCLAKFAAKHLSQNGYDAIMLGVKT